MNKKTILFRLSAILIFLFAFVTLLVKSSTYGSSLQESIAGKIVRFHVVANSDSDEDQNLKLAVRDGILDYLHPLMKNIDSDDGFNAAIEILNAQCPSIEDLSSEIIHDQGYDYSVHASVTKCYFPAKCYMDIILPPGEYTALKVVIGDGDGHNWWCVMYPTLCFIDSTNAVLPSDSKKELRCLLTWQEYDSILTDDDDVDAKEEDDNDSCNDDSDVTCSFRLWEWLQTWF